MLASARPSITVRSLPFAKRVYYSAVLAEEDKILLTIVPSMFVCLARSL
jgi:hypothetical protein